MERKAERKKDKTNVVQREERLCEYFGTDIIIGMNIEFIIINSNISHLRKTHTILMI